MKPTLQLKEVGVMIKNTSILSRVTFRAEPGLMVAVLGPSGSGKTTLLNTIAGRQLLSSGDITLGDQPLTKQIRRRMGYVHQADVGLSNLTLWETLFFNAMIRLPKEMSYSEKTDRVLEIIDILELKKCTNTVVGDVSSQGLSGGEKKRMNIACELLMDPEILLLDEPTSGLDSSTALNLIQQVQRHTTASNKVVVMTIHQPSTQIYMLFDSLVLLASGEVVYFGAGRNHPLDFFDNLGYTCQPHFNPADFLLDLLKSDQAAIAQLASANRSANKHLTEYVQQHSDPQELIIDLAKMNTSCSKPNVPVHLVNGSKDSLATLTSSPGNTMSSTDSSRWSADFWTQCRMLSWRNYKQARGRILHLYDVSQFAVMAIVVGTIFFQIPNTVELFRDVMGLIFFSLAYWTFSPTMGAIMAFPAERLVVQKERAAGAYRLSAYYLAKTVSEIPLYVIAPTCFYVTVFWMTGVGDVKTFFITWSLLLFNVFNAHGMGLLIGATFNNTRIALVIGEATCLICLLLSGFLTQTFPSWLSWARYVSMSFYSLSAMCIIVFQGMDPVPCNSTDLTFPTCLSDPSGDVTAQDVLHAAGITLPFHTYVSMMAVIFVVLRLGAYLSLRFLNKVK